MAATRMRAAIFLAKDSPKAAGSSGCDSNHPSRRNRSPAFETEETPLPLRWRSIRTRGRRPALRLRFRYIVSRWFFRSGTGMWPGVTFRPFLRRSSNGLIQESTIQGSPPSKGGAVIRGSSCQRDQSASWLKKFFSPLQPVCDPAFTGGISHP